MQRIAIGLLLFTMVLVGCAPASSTVQGGGGVPEPARTGPKRITAAMPSNGSVLWEGTLGLSLIELFSAGLVTFDPAGEPVTQLGEAVPTLENGLWRLAADGHMETTHRIREGARWHDGTPLTTDDLVFGAAVGREFPLNTNIGSGGFANIERMEVLDARTIVVSWKSPYIRANWLFSFVFAMPLPKHLLEASFAEDKASFLNQRFWTADFVGNGPFTVQEFVPGDHTLLKAYDDYILGRPNIDEVEVRYIPNANTLMANLLAGEIDLTLGTGLSPEQALRVAESWPAGTVIYSPIYFSGTAIYPQFVNPDPPIQASVPFRRALAHAVDRDALVQSIHAGIGGPAKAMPAPLGPDFAALEPSITDYEYDPRKAAQLTEGLGYAMGADGIFRDSANQELAVQVWTPANDDILQRSNLAVADYWRRVGVATTPRGITAAEAQSNAVRSSRPAFLVDKLRTDLDSRFLSSEVPLPENNFRGANRARYMNPDLDVLINRYFVTVPHGERVSILANVVRHLTDQVVVMPLFYIAFPQLMNKRLKNVEPITTWAFIPNAHRWELN